MISIRAKHFCAAVVLDDHDVVVRAADILKYMIGWKATKVREYAVRKGWDVR